MARDWQTTKIQDAPLQIIDGDRGTNYPKQADFYTSGHCLFLNAGNVTERGFDFSECQFITSEKDQQLRKGKLAQFDSVLTTRGTVGNVAFFSDAILLNHIRINSGMVVFRPDRERLLPDFLYQFLRSSLFREQVRNLTTGSAQPQLPIRDINRIELPIPPLPDQRWIARILGTFDDKIEVNRRMNETLEGMARALFKSWFVDFDPVRAKLDGRPPPGLDPTTAALFSDHFERGEFGLAPKGWASRRWGEIASLEYGKGIRDYQEATGPYQVFGTNGPVGWHTEPLCNGPGIIIGRKGAYRGIHFSPSPFYVIDTAFYLLPKIDLDLWWAYYELLRLDINGMDSGSAIPSTSRDDFYSLPVCVPPRKLLDAFGAKVALWHRRRYANESQSKTLAILRDALLPKLLSGEIRVPAAEKLAEEVA